MKIFNYHLLGLVILCISLISCGDDDTMDPVLQPSDIQEFNDGILVINEGPFAGGSASLDYYDRSKDSVLRNVYSAVNDGQVIGSILQSVTIIEDKAYLVVNNSAKIEVVDATTLEYISTISGVFGPRYIVDLGNGKAAVSEWGFDGVSGQVKLVDLATLAIQDSVSVSGPEQMIFSNDKLYVANSGGFGESNKVTVHNLDLSLQSAITVGKRTLDLVLDANEDIWVLSGGSYTDNDGASLCRIKNDEADICHDIIGFPSNLIINEDGNKIYFAESRNVNTLNIDDVNTVTSLLVNIDETVTIYGLGYDDEQEAILVGITPDFSSESITYVIYENGGSTKSFASGVLTNGYLSR